MKGAIIGDIIGSRFEFNNVKTPKFNLFSKECDFTDDTICTVAVMEALLSVDIDFKTHLVKWCKKYPNPMGCYGASFADWIWSHDHHPNNSFGNGAAMRVSPCAWAFKHLNDVNRAAAYSAGVSHNHPEGILGAMATAQAIFFLKKTKNKEWAKTIEANFYPIHAKYEKGVFNETCQGTVPVALRIIYESNSFEDAIRKTMLWGGDSDTLGAIVGGMAEALYGVPEDMWETAAEYLPNEMIKVIDMFYKRFVDRRISDEELHVLQ